MVRKSRKNFRSRKTIRLTLPFVVALSLVVVLAAFAANRVMGGIAEKNLVAITQDLSVQDGLHLQAMLRRANSVPGLASDPSVDGVSNPGLGQPHELLIKQLASPEAARRTFPSLLSRTDLTEFHIFDPEGRVRWSSDLRVLGGVDPVPTGALFQAALDGETVSSKVQTQASADANEDQPPLDLVQTFLPLTDFPGGNIIGVMRVDSDVTAGIGARVEAAKSSLFWVIVSTLSGLGLVMLGFIVAADIAESRASRKSMAIASKAARRFESLAERRGEALEEAQEKALQAEKLAAFGLITGDVADSLRDPLGAIRNAAFLVGKLINQGSTPAQTQNAKRYLEFIDHQVKRADQVIGDLMTFTRPSVPKIQETALNKVIERSVVALERKANVRISTRFAPGTKTVMADREQLEKVFRNLIHNAVEAMPGGGRIVISTRNVGAFVEVAFTDSGTGIEDGEKNRIFDPLYTTKSKGSGLGLAVCREIVTSHQGDIRVESEPGTGTTFTIILPASDALVGAVRH